MEINNEGTNLVENTKVMVNKENANSNSYINSSGLKFDKILKEVVDEKGTNLEDINKNADSMDIENITSELQLEYIKKKMEDISGKQNSAIARLARQFGVSEELMRFILNSLGISPADLLNPAKKKEVMEKLSNFFSLKEKSKEKLGQVMDEIQSSSAA